MPRLSFVPFDQASPQPIELQGRPLLIHLWATWCGPCLTELQALRDQADQLNDAGLNVLALSVDGLGQPQQSGPADARQMVDEMGFPWKAGMATRQLLDKLLVVEMLTLHRQVGLSVPMSFLFDGGGRLAAMYQGAVAPEQLFTDLRQLNLPLQQRRDAAVPLAGRWLSPPRQLLLRAVARVFRDEGYEDDHAHYLQLDAEAISSLRAAAANDSEKQQIDTQLASANYDLAVALISSGDSAEAMGHLRRTLELNPDHVDALVNLGVLLARNRQPDAAIPWLTKAVKLQADSLVARTNLAMALIDTENWHAARDQLEAIVRANPENAPSLARLGRTLIEIGDVAAAIPRLREAIRLNRQDFAATLSLGWLLATYPDENLRSGEEAVGLGERLRSQTRGENPFALEVLAAAYAELGRFDEAQDIQQSAIRRLGNRGGALREAMRQRLETYQAELAHRDADGKYP